MLNNTTKPNDKSDPTSVNANATPDPWKEELSPQPKPIRPSRQVSLNPERQITAAPALDGILSPEGDPTALQIPAHTNHPTSDLTEVLLQEELKVNATQAKSLWDHIRDLLALWWWSGPQDGQPS